MYAWAQRLAAPGVTNAFGIVFEAYYVYAYWTHAGAGRAAYSRALQYAAAVLATLLLLALATRSVGVLGLGCVALNVAAYASPCGAAVEAARSRCVASLPALLCLASLLCSTVWLAYACVGRDAFIAVPNALGAALSLGQVRASNRPPPCLYFFSSLLFSCSPLTPLPTLSRV